MSDNRWQNRSAAALDIDQYFLVSPWLKYLLFQIPGWIVTAIILVVLARHEWLSVWLAAACFAAWLLKDLLLYRFFRQAYEPGITGAARLIGERGIAEGDLRPRGYVRVRGELWSAVVNGADAISAGAEVEVIGAERMELTVRAALN